MISALAQHIWLLITIRHPMRGLPCRSVGLVFAVVMASAIVATVRWGNPMMLVVHSLLLCVIAVIAPVQIATAYALMSLGIDLVAIEQNMSLFTAWEIFGAAYILWRSLR